MVSCDFFTSNLIPLNGTKEIDNSNDLFYVYICTEGNFEVKIETQTMNFKEGDTILIPAAMQNYVLKGNATLLQIFIK